MLGFIIALPTQNAVLHLGDPCVRIALALPILVGELLAPTLAIHTNQIVGRRRLDVALDA